MNVDMIRPGDETGIRPRSSAAREAWTRTNDEMELIAERRREGGWDVVSMPAVHTSPVGKDQGDDDRFGLVHVLPDNHAGSFSDAFERGAFPEYQAYRNEVDGYVYQVTELVDPESGTIVLVAGQYDRRLAEGMITTALDEECLFVHLRTIDGTVLGSVRYESFDALLPDGDRNA